MPGEPRSQPHQLPKNPLSELPVVKCKVGQCHSESEGLMSEGMNQTGAANPQRLSGSGRLQIVSWVLGQTGKMGKLQTKEMACGRND